jgi:integrase
MESEDEVPLRGVGCVREADAILIGEGGTGIRSVHALLGHKDVSTTQIYTHVMQSPGPGVRSPLDS